MVAQEAGSFATNEYVLLSFFGLSTLAFLWYMYKVIGTFALREQSTCHVPHRSAVEYQNMDPKDFEDDASEDLPEVELKDFTVEGKLQCPCQLANIP